MKAAQITQYGDAGVVRVVQDVPRPSAGNGRVVIAVHAASLNPADSAIRQGYMHQMAPLPFPATLGIDIAGTVAEAGAGPFKIGDRVYGVASLMAGATGAFAEYAAVPVGLIAKAPASLSFVELAALPLAGVSALMAVHELVTLGAGSRILIHGGSGGIGTIAIQLAKHRGAYVATTCRGSAAAYVKSLGADEVIDFEKSSFQTLLNGYDAVFDTAGGETYARSYSVLRKSGTIISMLAQPDADLAARHGVTALGLRTDVTSARLERLAQLVNEGVVKVHVDRVFTLEMVREAFLARESGKVKGKIVLQIKKED